MPPRGRARYPRPPARDATQPCYAGGWSCLCVLVFLVFPGFLRGCDSSLKARVLLSLGYGCGLRAGEVVRLKVKHIDSAQKIIRIEQSKGRKDRNVMLSSETLDLLRQWWKARPSRHDAQTPVPERWLFPGTRAGKPMTTRQLNPMYHE